MTILLLVFFSILTTSYSLVPTKFINKPRNIIRRPTSSIMTQLHSSSSKDHNDNNDDSLNTKSSSSSSSKTTSIRFLGKGEEATIHPGVVLVAPTHEYNHFLLRSVVFIYAMGFNQYEEFVTRGVIIDHPTAFTIGEMTGGSVSGKLASNVLFQGGDAGNDSVMLLHCHGSTSGTTDHDQDDDDSGGDGEIKCRGEMIGANSGIYQGGVLDAMNLVDEGKVSQEGFKFFFNHVEFSEKELEAMLTATNSDGDAWASMQVPAEFVLKNDYKRGDAWSFLRNQIRQLDPSLE